MDRPARHALSGRDQGIPATRRGCYCTGRGVSFQVDRGEFISVMGPSGSGKSTLLNLMGCLDTPTTGDIFISGTRIGDMSDVELTNLRRDGSGSSSSTSTSFPSSTSSRTSRFP